MKVLEDIYKAFMYFAHDFEFLERDNNNSIYFAMDNDVFSLVLMPMSKLKYVNILGEDDFDFLKSQAFQFAVTIRELVKNDVVIALPSHAIEYKETILHILNSIIQGKYKLKREIDPNNIQNKLAEIINQNDVSAIESFKENISEFVDALVNLISLSKFARIQLDELIKEKGPNRILPFEDILAKEEIIVAKDDFGFAHRFKVLAKRKKLLARENDTKALMLITTYNREHSNKKIVLITGDKVLHTIYKSYYKENNLADEVYALRYPKYFLPFLSRDNDTIFSDNNKRLLTKFRIQMRDLFNDDDNEVGHSHTDNKFANEAKKIKSELKTLLNLNTFKDDSLSDLSELRSEAIETIIKLTSDKDFQNMLDSYTSDLLVDIADKISVVPIINELVKHQLTATKYRFLFRHPFVISADSEKKQILIDNLVSDLLQGKISNKLFKIQEQLSDYYLSLLNAVVTNLVAEKDVTLAYIKQARNYGVQHNLNESYLFESFVYRTNIESINDVIQAKKAINQIDSENESPIDQLRRRIEECLLGTTALIINNLEFFNETTEVCGIAAAETDKVFMAISKKLKKTLEDLQSILKSTGSHQLRRRAYFHVYMNIATLYIYNKFFLKLPIDKLIFGRSFFAKNLDIYRRFHNRIGYKHVLVNLLSYDLAETGEEKDAFKDLAIKSMVDIQHPNFGNEVKLLSYEVYLMERILEKLDFSFTN